MKRFVIVRNLLYVTACLTKLHIIARCIAEQTVGVRVDWAEIFTGRLFKHRLLFFWKLFRPGLYSNRPLIKQGPLFECIRYFKSLKSNKTAHKILIAAQKFKKIFKKYKFVRFCKDSFDKDNFDKFWLHSMQNFDFILTYKIYQNRLLNTWNER